MFAEKRKPEVMYLACLCEHCASQSSEPDNLNEKFTRMMQVLFFPLHLVCERVEPSVGRKEDILGVPLTGFSMAV